MHPRYSIQLHSNEYGLEEFGPYFTAKEATAALSRLQKSAAKHFTVDGILRSVVLIKSRCTRS